MNTGIGKFISDSELYLFQESKVSTTSRSIFYLVKKAESKWWDRLLKQGGKPPIFLKVDWNKWVDEDEQDEKTDKGEF